MTFSCLNLKKIMLLRKRSFRIRNPGLVTGFFVPGLPTLAFHGINSDSAGNYQLIDEESTGRILSADCQHSPSMGYIVILPGITSLLTRNPPEESCPRTANTRTPQDKQLFCRELPAHRSWFRPERSKCVKNPQSSNNFWISKFKSYILQRPTF
jgi:hypothetical protein